jgi:hypothetical protein
MKYTIAILLLLSSPLLARDYVYQGEWVTTSGRQLNGSMTCILTPTAKHKYNGRFYGVWMGQSFDCPVQITGPIEKLQGFATLEDGSSYAWAGFVSKDEMRAKFNGSSYNGYFNLKRNKNMEKPKKVK